jgi:hypothetical protein
MSNEQQRTMPGLESFWETCDHDGVSEHPLMRELCYRLDAIQRYRALITDAEDSGNDDALELLTRHFEQQHEIVRRLRDELTRTT